METRGIVRDEEGHETEGALRPNGVVTFTVGRMTRHISLTDFSDLGLTWKPHFWPNQDQSERTHEPIRFFRITGEGLA